MHPLTIGICSEECIIRWFPCGGEVIECACTNLDGIAAYCNCIWYTFYLWQCGRFVYTRIYTNTGVTVVPVLKVGFSSCNASAWLTSKVLLFGPPLQSWKSPINILPVRTRWSGCLLPLRLLYYGDLTI